MAHWSDREVAVAYRHFTENFPMYAATSRDLVTRAGISAARSVVDLCSGTGQTSEAILAELPPDGRVLAVDGSAAMQAEARRAIHDDRVEYVVARADDWTVPEPVDAVVCNSAIWQTDMPATFAAARLALRPGGRLVFNIGLPFIRLPAEPARPQFMELMLEYAKADHGFAPPAYRKTGRSPELIEQWLRDAGFADVKQEIERYESTVDQTRAWLSMPIFAGALSALSEEHRIEIVEKAYKNADKNEVSVDPWLITTAQ
jgi:ubiquinone/menaquinone biosynthesis C-methylase UbiE